MMTVFRWFRAHEDFRLQYANAKEASAEAMSEDILDLADGSLDVVRKGNEKKANALAQSVKLQVDTRKWIMSKMKPKKYGEKSNSIIIISPVQFTRHTPNSYVNDQRTKGE